MRKMKWSTLLTLAALLALVLPAGASTHVFPDIIPLPDGFRPEGIAVGQGATFYTGSLADGAIYRGSLVTGEGDIFIPGEEGAVSVGMDYDTRSKYLYVAGGPTGVARVFDTKDGSLVATYQLADPGFFINDAFVTQTAVYFTNSNQPYLYRLPLGPGGSLPDSGDFEVIELTGEWQQVPGFNANGVVADKSGENVIIVNSTLGLLYHVDPATGYATGIDLGGETVTMGDGLLLLGQTLYVVRNRANEIVVIELADDYLSGVVVDRFTQSNFNVPTTLAAFAHSVYAVNAKFGTVEDPDASPYEIVRIPLR